MSACQLVRAASLLLSLGLLGLARAGVTAPSLDASAIADKQLLDFGDVIINLDGSPQTVTFRNLGANAVQVFSFTMQPADAPFKVLSTTCVTLQDHPTSATILATLQSCSVTFAAHPTVTGPATAAFNIDLNTVDTSAYLSSTIVHLKVNGLAPLTCDKPLLDFGDVLVNSQSAPQTVTVTNTGTQDLAIATDGLSKDPGFVGVGFTVFGLGSSVLAPGKSVTMVIQATPVQVGSQGISIFVYVTQPNQPQIVVQCTHVRANALPLPASPVPSPSPSPSPSPKPSPSPSPVPSPKANTVSIPTASTVTVAPALLEFGNVPLGSSSGFKALTFTNTGNKKISIQSVALTAAAGYQAAGFSLARTGSSCYVGKRLAAGASCTVWVKAAPTVQGSNGANVYLTYVDTAGVAGTSQMALLHASAAPAARRALRA